MRKFILIAAGALGLYPLNYAQAMNNNVDETHFDLNHRICRSIVNGNVNGVRRLIEAGANVNAKDEDGNSLLVKCIWECASLEASYQIANLLIDGGADVNMRCGYDKLTPLHWALIRGNEDMVSLLVNREADVNAVNIFGQTPLDYADGYYRSIRLLAIYNAHNGRNVEPPLMIDFFDLVNFGSANVLSCFLRDNNIDINHRYGRRHGGITALELAVLQGKVDIVRVLLDNNATVTRRSEREARSRSLNEISNLINRSTNREAQRLENLLANIRNRH